MSVTRMLGPVGNVAEHAINYADLGLEIFPVNPADKTPLISQYKATTDTTQIEAWWRQWPHALIGHRISTNHIILDIDPRHGGLDVWKALMAELPARPTTRWHRSGRGDGGGHTWWLKPADKLNVTKLDEWAKQRGLGHDLKTRWTCGIDVLHRDHRYTILPPSPHPDTGQPYEWALGLETEPAPMPALLADLITNDTPPTPPQPPKPKDPDSIADWYTDNHTWPQLLTRHGWTLRAGDGNSDGSRWRHPQATAAYSATIRHGCLFVYSPNTPFEPTAPSDPHGYTRFAAYATLEHQGDQSAAARTIRRDSPRTPTLINPQPPPKKLPSDEFWDTRVELQHIRDFARSRRCSPWAVLGVALVRIAAATPPFVVLPPLVGSHLSLNTYIGLIGPSGAGKDAAIAAGSDVLDVDVKMIGIGSGEGLLDQYVTYRQPDKKNDDPGGVEQHETSVIFTAPEIETLAALKGRSSATLMPELRNAWTGRRLGFAYANRERRLYINAHHYRLGLIVGIQPERADILLNDASAGTPQRFLWLPATDPNAPETAPPEPNVLSWECPETFWRHGAGGYFELAVCDEAKTTIDQARLNRLRGEGDALDGHALACRLKIAALIALLHRHISVNDDDWQLSGQLQTVSDQTRDEAAWTIEHAHRQANQARGKAEGEREIVKTETVEAAATARVAALVRRKLTSDWTVHSDLRIRIAARDRRHFENAIERLQDAGQIEVSETENGSRYRLAEATS